MSESAIQPAIGLPPDDTVEFFRSKGTYPISRRWWDVWEEEHLRAFTVAKIMDRQLLERIRASLDEVLAGGGTFEMWKERILPELKSAGWWGKVQNKELTGTNRPILVSEGRLRTIYGTNLRMARAAGQWKRIQALKAGRPYLLYSAMRDGRTRPKHRIWGGIDSGRPIVLPVDHPAWRWMYPPNGWNCRCLVIQLSEADLKRRGLSVTTDAQLLAVGWPIGDTLDPAASSDFVRGHGIIESVPTGVDPGFGYNVGQHHLKGIAARFDDADLSSIIPAATQLEPLQPKHIAKQSFAPMDEIEATAKWVELIGGDELKLSDPVGEPLIIGSDFWFDSKGRSKIAKRGRERFLWHILDTIKDPAEIWYGWETDDPAKRRADAPPHPSQIIRRYIGHYNEDGSDVRIVVFVDMSRDGWKVMTAFDADERYSDARRHGVLAWRRQ